MANQSRGAFGHLFLFIFLTGLDPVERFSQENITKYGGGRFRLAASFAKALAFS